MTEPAGEVNVEAQAVESADRLGREGLGRDLTGDEAEALASIFRAAIQALKHGFIGRLAEHVRSERETESVEEFFGDNLHTD